MTFHSSILAASLFLSALAPFVAASPTIPTPSTAPTSLSANPPWTSSEVTVCSADFLFPGVIDPRDCLTAFDKLPQGSTPVPFVNDVSWPYKFPQGLPQMVSHGSCAIKITASGRNATSLNGVLLVPDRIREMADWVIDECAWSRGQGGFVTRQIVNTKAYLLNPNNNLDFDAGFRKAPTLLDGIKRLRLTLTSNINHILQPSGMVPAARF